MFCKSSTAQHKKQIPVYMDWGLMCSMSVHTVHANVLKDKMHDFLQIFSFAHHGSEELESTCLLSHLEVVAVITVCYIF